MQTSPEVNLSSALERFKNHQASSDDLDLIAKAMDLGQIQFEIIPTGDSQTILQSGGVDYGKSNIIHVSGSVIGSQTISEISADQVESILHRLEKRLDEKALPGRENPRQKEEHKKINCQIYIVLLLILVALVIAYSTLIHPTLATQAEIRDTQEKEATLTYIAVSFLPSITVTSSILTTPTPLPSPFTETPAPIHTSTLTPTPTCPYVGSTDDETIRALIAIEAEAVNREDIDIILTIFTDDAVFADFAVPTDSPPRIWIGPLARYQEDLFKNTDLRGSAHFDILPAGPPISGDTAYYTSGSKGSYLSGEKWEPYYNGSTVGEKATLYGSDHWTLRRGPNGCWEIIRLDFNAGHIRFP